MSASGTREERRGGRLLTALFWAGVALAPVAALVLLMGQGEGPLRVAAVLAVLAVVLIGLSITLSRDPETMRLDLEEVLLDEVDALRGDVRQEISAAARATHKAFGERIQLLHETVDTLRAELQAARVGVGQADSGAAAGPPPGAAAVAGTAPVGPEHVGPQHVGPHFAGPEHVGPPHVGPPHVGPQHVGPPHVGPPHVGPPHVGPPHVATAAVHHPAGAGVAGPMPGRAHVPAGVVRHTETVHVTTRQTIVGPHDDSGRGTVYGGGHIYGARLPDAPAGDWPSAAPPEAAQPSPPATASGPRPSAPRVRRTAEPAEESWTEQKLRERLGDRAGDTRRPWPFDRDDDPAADDRWSGMRAGDRWASVRSDEHGSELRMGERRAAMHAAESGTELRIEDRWAAVRREESHRTGRRHDVQPSWEGEARPGWDDEARPGWGAEERAGRRGDAGPGWGDAGAGWGDAEPSWAPDDHADDRRGFWSEAEWSQPHGAAALPAGGVEPSGAWASGDEWGQPEPAPAWRGGDRYRDDDGYGRHAEPGGGDRQRGRLVEFEPSDERWR